MFFYYIEYKLSTVSNSYNFKRNCLEQKLDSIEILALGSSQILYSINPTYFNLKTYNLGNVSQSLYYDTHLALKYIDKMPKLKYVILGISYFSFEYQLIDTKESWRDYYYTQFWDVDFPEIDHFDLKCYSKLFLYTPKVALELFKNGLVLKINQEINENGYMKIDTTANSINIDDSSGYKRVYIHDHSYKATRFSENELVVDSFLKILKKKNIVPIILTPPVYSTYSKFINKAKMDKNIKAIKAICDKYNSKYLNYFEDTTFVKTNFYDNDHLNFIGAEKLSKRINDLIMKQDSITP